MKLAVISVTQGGSELADRMVNSLRSSEVFDGIDIYCKTGCSRRDDNQEYSLLSELVEQIYDKYNAFLFIMAAGIVVRVIAPYIKDKRVDPAVLVMDEQGKHVISLLAGHIGRANDLAMAVERLTGAEAVITTASDVLGRVAADTVAVQLGLSIEPFSMLKTINSAIVNGKNVKFMIDPELINAKHMIQTAQGLGLELLDLNLLKQSNNFEAVVIISDKRLDIKEPHLFLRPQSIVAGIGCRKNTPASAIIEALHDAFFKTGKSMMSLDVIASSVVKQQEVGLIEAAKVLGAKLCFYSNQELQQVIDGYQLQVSEYVLKQIGVGNVCEAAAVAVSKNQRLLFRKTKYQGITIALAEKFM